MRKESSRTRAHAFSIHILVNRHWRKAFPDFSPLMAAYHTAFKQRWRPPFPWDPFPHATFGLHFFFDPWFALFPCALLFFFERMHIIRIASHGSREDFTYWALCWTRKCENCCSSVVAASDSSTQTGPADRPRVSTEETRPTAKENAFFPDIFLNGLKFLDAPHFVLHPYLCLPGERCDDDLSRCSFLLLLIEIGMCMSTSVNLFEIWLAISNKRGLVSISKWAISL